MDGSIWKLREKVSERFSTNLNRSQVAAGDGCYKEEGCRYWHKENHVVCEK